MPIKKQYLKSKPQVKVTFEITKEDAQNAASVVLLSEHNNWAPLPFKMLKKGNFKVTANIPTDASNSFQFIYKATSEDGNQFTLLPGADEVDSFIDNNMGGKNAVLNVSNGF